MARTTGTLRRGALIKPATPTTTGPGDRAAAHRTRAPAVTALKEPMYRGGTPRATVCPIGRRVDSWRFALARVRDANPAGDPMAPCDVRRRANGGSASTPGLR